MDKRNGLYLKGIFVSEIDYSITKQGFDVLKPSERKASFTNSFTLPDTQTVREITESAEQLSAGGVYPYQLIPATLIEDGFVLFNGFAELVSFTNGWTVNLLSSLVDFFDQIREKKLSELDLSRYDHYWNFESINNFAGATTGIVYPCVDSGAIDNNIFPYDAINPAIYAEVVALQILKEAGYTAVGPWLKDELLKRIAIPYTGAEAVSQSDDWVLERMARVTTEHQEYGKEINQILPLTIDNNLLDGFTDGKRDNFKPDKYAYVPDMAMKLHVQAQQTYNVQVITGTVETVLAILVNGQEAATVTQTHVGVYNRFKAKTDTIELDEWIECRKGDVVQIQWYFGLRTATGRYFVDLVTDIDNTFVSFEPDPAVKFNDIWPVSRNLPDMTCGEFMVSLALLTCSDFDIDEKRRTFNLARLDSVIENIPKAVDWSSKIDESTEPELVVKFEDYGQRNLLKWKEQEKKDNVGYGDGYIKCNAKNLPAEVDLFELPFSFAIDSLKTIPGLGNPPLIETRSVTKKNDELTVTKKQTVPTLLLIEPTKIVTVSTMFLNDAGDVAERSVNLTGCWAGIRPVGLIRQDNAYTLAFSPMPGQKEQTLDVRYFSTLKRILRRPRKFTPYFDLERSDVGNFSQSVPVRLRQVRAGSFNLNDHYFYVNKIASYRSNASCPVTLIAL